MGQLNFQDNYGFVLAQTFVNVSDFSLSFWGFNLWENISLKTINMAWRESGTSARVNSISLGLYSLNGLTLSLINSISGTDSGATGSFRYFSLTDVSTTQNLSPGTWYWGILVNLSSNNSMILAQGITVLPENSFPGGFIAGVMTDSTSALPSSYVTSDLDVTGRPEMSFPYILISA